jgi:hypothetical protein
MSLGRGFLLVMMAGLLAAPAGVSAQRGNAPSRPPANPSRTPAPTVLLPPQNVLPPSGTLILPSSPAVQPGPVAPAYRPRGDFRFRRQLGGGGFGLPYGSAPIFGPDAADDLPQSLGVLDLDVSPHYAQVFVDGAYAGTVDDFLAAGVPMTPGVHTLVLRAAGYDPVSIPVSIAAGRMTSYRAAMQPATRPPAAPAPAPLVTAATFYIIPGCYFGNRPPDNVSLPSGCDARNVRKLDTRR